MICAKRLGAISAQVLLSGVMPDVDVDEDNDKDVGADAFLIVVAAFVEVILAVVLSFSGGGASVDAAATVVCFEP